MLDIMERKNISWREIIEITGLTRMTLSNASKGKGVTLATAQAIAKALGESVETVWPTEETAAEENEVAA